MDVQRSEGLMTDMTDAETPQANLDRLVASLCDDFSPEAVAAAAMRVADTRSE